jgi:glutathione S-transferase
MGVPADGDTKLTESLVVVEYLDDKYGGDKPLLPRDPVQRAKVPSPALHPLRSEAAIMSGDLDAHAYHYIPSTMVQDAGRTWQKKRKGFQSPVCFLKCR